MIPYTCYQIPDNRFDCEYLWKYQPSGKSKRGEGVLVDQGGQACEDRLVAGNFILGFEF